MSSPKNFSVVKLPISLDVILSEYFSVKSFSPKLVEMITGFFEISLEFIMLKSSELEKTVVNSVPRSSIISSSTSRISST